MGHSCPRVWVNAASQHSFIVSGSPSNPMIREVFDCLKGNLDLSRPDLICLDQSTPMMLLLYYGMHMLNILDLSTPILKCLDHSIPTVKCLDQNIPLLLFRLDLVLPVHIF